MESPTGSQSAAQSAATSVNDEFEPLAISIRRHFKFTTDGKQGKPVLFRTAVKDLYARFLDALPPELRQEYTCSACRKFVDRYGSLVTIAADGTTTPVLWNPESAPASFASAIRTLFTAVCEAPIAGVFISKDKNWGVAQTGEWHHMHVIPPAGIVFAPTVSKTPGQAIAEKQEEHAMLLRGLAEFPLAVVEKAHSLLTTEALFRSETCIGVAKWLLDLHEQRRATKHERRRDNLTWRATATAPAGYCHVRSSMIGTLLEDLVAGLPFAQIKAKFDAKMHPLQYQRPTAAPTAGNIARAEKIIADLKAAGALGRRFARLADIKPLWTPAASSADEKEGVFAHLKSKTKQAVAEASLEVPAITMTWDKFARTVLPTAERIEYLVPQTNQMYMAMITAKDPAAPPILQWDLMDARNPVSWYFYVSGSAPQRWNLLPDSYHPVSAVCLQPTLWNPQRSFSHHGEKVFFLLKDARDTQYVKSCGFFPEFLRNELHEIRSTLEAYAKEAVVEDRDLAECCGIGLQKGSTWNFTFRVVTKGGLRTSYRLDRWD